MNPSPETPHPLSARDRRAQRRIVLFTVCAVALLGAALISLAVHNDAPTGSDGRTTESICRMILTNRTAGRQALVSSAWHPPLPVILSIPIAAAIPRSSVPLVALVFSVIAAGSLLLLFDLICRKWRLGPLRFVLLCALAVNSAFLDNAINGGATLTAAIVLILIAYGLAQWIVTRRLRFLVYFGGGLALAAWLHFAFWPWTLLACILFLADHSTPGGQRHQRRAAAVLGLLPMLYTAGLWFLMNWLIMGDALYFLRSLQSPAVTRIPIQCALAEIATADRVLAAALTVLIVIHIIRRDLVGATLAALATAPVLITPLMQATGFSWSDDQALLHCAFPLALVAVAHTLAVVTPRYRALRTLAGAVPLAFSIWILSTESMVLSIPTHTGRPPAASAHIMDARRTLDSIEAHVLARSRYAKVFVCGYDSFALLGDDPPDTFEYGLDFNFNKVKQDYAGHALFVLVHAPDGTSSIDSIHWKYKDIFALGSHHTLYDGEWGDWRLFEIIQAEYTP